VGSARQIKAEITGVTIAADTTATVRFTLRNELDQPLKGLRFDNISFVFAQLRPGTGGRGSEWRSYPTRVRDGAVQGTTDTRVAAQLKDNGDGTYEYTTNKPLNAYGPNGATYDPNLTHRFGLETRSTTTAAIAWANNALYTFVPATGSTTDLPVRRDIVDNDTCFACHDLLTFHGGPRGNPQYCVLCHNPGTTDGITGNSVSFPVLIHKIHMGAKLTNGYKIRNFDFSNIVWTQDQRNCQTCHQESDSDTPQASNFRTVPYSTACGACHDNVNFQTGENHGPSQLVATDDQCVTCHGPDSTIDNGNLRVSVVHLIPEKEEGKKYRFNVLSASNTAPGQNPTVRFSVTDPTNNNAPYNILTAAPFQGASLTVNVAWSATNYTNKDSGSATALTGTPGQPFSINTLTPGNATGPDADGAFTVTTATPLPVDVTGTLGLGLQGRLAVDVNNDGTKERIPVASATNYAAATGTVAARRVVVDVKKCDDCHNQLRMHGDSRTDNVQLCVMCHNPTATDINRRVAGTDCVNTLGADDVSVDFKYMIHALHNGVNSGLAICGFGNTAIQFDHVKFPGKLNNCEACHLTPAPNATTATYYPVDPNAVHATTVDAGADRASLADDVAWSPNVAVCTGCHVSVSAEAHMLQNGGSKTLTKQADGTTASGPLETCQTCHGPGRVADVKLLHKVNTFEFQAPVNP